MANGNKRTLAWVILILATGMTFWLTASDLVARLFGVLPPPEPHGPSNPAYHQAMNVWTLLVFFPAALLALACTFQQMCDRRVQRHTFWWTWILAARMAVTIMGAVPIWYLKPLLLGEQGGGGIVAACMMLAGKILFWLCWWRAVQWIVRKLQARPAAAVGTPVPSPHRGEG